MQKILGEGGGQIKRTQKCLKEKVSVREQVMWA